MIDALAMLHRAIAFHHAANQSVSDLITARQSNPSGPRSDAMATDNRRPVGCCERCAGDIQMGLPHWCPDITEGE